MGDVRSRFSGCADRQNFIESVTDMKKNIRKQMKKSPLLLTILVTGLLFTGISVNGANGIYRDISRPSGYSPALALMFCGIHEEVYPWSDGSVTMVADNGPEGPTISGDSVSGGSVSGGSASDGGVGEDTGSPSAGEGQEGAVSGDTVSGGGLSENGVPGTSPAETESQTEQTESSSQEESSQAETDQAETDRAETDQAETGQTETDQQETSGETELTFQQVSEDYFDDAVFIGDSRTVGLYEYGRIEDRAQFYAKTSLTIYDIIEKKEPIVKTADDRGYITVEQALSENQFGKIYIMIGLNEMGTGTAQSFAQAYADVVNRIKELQPNAIIYIQAIMHVAEKRDQSDPIFNNANIEERNQLLAQLADNQTVFYLNINEALCDENGYLYSDWTFDQVHLKAAYYQNWKDYLLSHAIVRP